MPKKLNIRVTKPNPQKINQIKIPEMELFRNICRRSLFAYKTEIRVHSRKRSTEMQKTMILSSRNDNTQSRINDLVKPKEETVCTALGATDELSSYLGLAREFASDSGVEHPYVDKLKRVQMILFDINHAISKSSPGKMRNFETKHTKDLEEWTLEYANGLPPPEDYIIPVILF